jgi:hypothetical protein
VCSTQSSFAQVFDRRNTQMTAETRKVSGFFGLTTTGPWYLIDGACLRSLWRLWYRLLILVPMLGQRIIGDSRGRFPRMLSRWLGAGFVPPDLDLVIRLMAGRCSAAWRCPCGYCMGQTPGNRGDIAARLPESDSRPQGRNGARRRPLDRRGATRTRAAKAAQVSPRDLNAGLQDGAVVAPGEFVGSVRQGYIQGGKALGTYVFEYLRQHAAQAQEFTAAMRR